MDRFPSSVPQRKKKSSKKKKRKKDKSSKKSKKKKSRKSRKSRGGSDSDSDNSDTPRSSISGLKIRKKLDKNLADHQRDSNRADLLRFYNSQFG